MLVEKINLDSETFLDFFKKYNFLFTFGIVQKKLLDTLRVPVSRTRAPVTFFGAKTIHWLCSRSAGRVIYWYTIFFINL